MNGNITFQGHIEAVTDDGCYGVIQLNRPYEGITRAVISGSTVGRTILMSTSESGLLEVGMLVSGIGVRLSGALEVLEISPATA